MSHQRGSSSSSALGWLLLIVIGAYVIFVVPLCPTLTVTFKITYMPAKLEHTLEVPSHSYTKSSLSSVAGIAKGDIMLIYVAGTVGHYSVSVAVTYGNEKLPAGTFTSLGEGTYQIRVVYWPRAEDKSTPYAVTFTLFFGTSQVATATAWLFPT